MARLILDAEGGKREHPVSGTVVIGRSAQASLPVEDAKLSREHCSVFFDGTRFVVEDLASRNGTFLNGNRIVSVAQLHSGDEIKIGNTVLLFRLDPTDPGAGDLRPATHRAPAAAPAGTRSTQAEPRETALPPSLFVRALAWLVLAAALAGGTFGLKHVFVWALREIAP